MAIEREIRGRRLGRGWRTIGLLLWLSIVIAGLGFYWVRHDGLNARWSAVQEDLNSIIPLGLMTAYGTGRLAWLWWPRSRPQTGSTPDILIFKRKRSASIGFLVLIGAFLALMFQNLREPDTTAIDWTFPLLLSAGWLVVLVNALRGGPPLVLDSVGISGLGQRGRSRIPWERIEKITLQHGRVHSAIDFILKPETRVSSSSKGKLQQMSVSPDTYGVEPEVLWEAIEDFHRRKVVFR